MGSLEEFLAGLRSMAILPQEECLRLQADVPDDGEEAYAVRLADQLLDDGQLTLYQRDLLLQSNSSKRR